MTGQLWTERFVWTDENTERLRELWNQGLTGYEIAEILGRTRCAVLGKLNRIGLLDGSRSHSPWGNERFKQARLARMTKPSKPTKQERERRVVVPPTLTVAPPPPPEIRPSIWSGVAGEIDVIRLGECRWPIGDPVEVLCKAPTNPRMSYCPYHHQIAIKPMGEPKAEYEKLLKIGMHLRERWR